MSKIILEPFNETYFKIRADQGPEREIRDFFTITVPTFKKKWNGKIRLFNSVPKTLYRGLLPSLMEWAKKNAYEVETNGLDKLEDFDLDTLRRVVSGFEITSGGEHLEPYDYQFSALLRCLKHKRALLLSPTGSGKSLIIYCLIRILEQITTGKILIIVPTTNLISQMWGDFADYSSTVEWGPLNHCHQIYEGQAKSSNARIYISTWQSLKDMPREYFLQFSAVIGDEAHMYSAKCAKYIIGCCEKAQFKIGTTATIKDTKAHIMILQGLFGTIYETAKTKTLMKRDILSPLKIECILLKHPPQSYMDYWGEIEYVITNERRNKFICNLALSLTGNTIVLYHYVDRHGEVLKEMLLNHAKRNGRNIYFIAGKVDMDEREYIRKIVEDDKDAIIVASFKTFSFGVNIKNLHNVIFASPSKDRIRIMQSIGRELRKHESKAKAFLFDVADDLSYARTQKNYTYEHFIERLRVYFHEKFEYTTHQLELI